MAGPIVQAISPLADAGAALLDERHRLVRHGRELGGAGGSAQGEQGGKGDLPGVESMGRPVRLQYQIRLRVKPERTNSNVQRSEPSISADSCFLIALRKSMMLIE
ncbi:hypothetical protein [Methylorubrum aminovorans]